MCILKHGGCMCIYAALFGLGPFAVASILAAPALPSQDRARNRSNDIEDHLGHAGRNLKAGPVGLP